MHLDPRRLRILREVALRGTVTAAAEALGYTPSAVSQQLAALEREIGARLMERRGRGMRLTEAGDLLVQRTEPVLAALEEARAVLERWSGTIVGTVRVAAAGSVARELVIPAAAQLAREYPELRVLVHESDDGMHGLRLGDLDVAVAHEYGHEPRSVADDVTRVALFEEPMLLAAPAGRFAAPVALADLAGEVWAAEPAASACGTALRGACRIAGFEPDVRYTSTENSGVLSAVSSAGAVSLVARIGVHSPPPGVDVLPLAEGAPRRTVYAAHRRGDPVRPAIAVVVDRLCQAGRALAGA